jgi:hypothetical protein
LKSTIAYFGSNFDRDRPCFNLLVDIENPGSDDFHPSWLIMIWDDDYRFLVERFESRASRGLQSAGSKHISWKDFGVERLVSLRCLTILKLQ